MGTLSVQKRERAVKLHNIITTAMGRQGDKHKKKLLMEDHLPEEKATPVAEQIQHEKKDSILSCSNIFLMLLTVIASVIVTAVIVKTVELEKISVDQAVNIGRMKAEAENTNQQLQNLLSESIEKAKIDETLIKSLNSETEGMNAKIETMISQIENKDKTNTEYQKTQVNLQKVIEKREVELTTLSDNLKKGFESFQEEKKTISEQLEASKQDHVSLQKKYEIDMRNVITENEEETTKLNQLISDKDEEMLTKANSIEYLEETLVIKSESVSILKEENRKLSTDMTEFTEEANREIEKIEEEKTKCMQDFETSRKTLLEERIILEENIKGKEEDMKSLQIQMDVKIKALTSEYETKIEEFDNSNNQLRVEIDAEKKEKSKIVEEKASLSENLDDAQLKLTKVTKDLQEAILKQEICNKENVIDSLKVKQLDNQILDLTEKMSTTQEENRVIAEKVSKVESEKVEGSKQLQDLETKFDGLSQEKTKLESEYKDISAKLSKLEKEKVKESLKSK